MFLSNGALLCGTHRGSIYVIRTPLSNAPNGIFHYLAHSARVTHVRIYSIFVSLLIFVFFLYIVVAFHEALIISCCEDGILMLWGIQKQSTKKEDWTEVVLQKKASFLRLVS